MEKSLLKLTTKKGLRVTLRILKKYDLENILELQNYVCNSLPDETLFIKAGREFVLSHLQGKSGTVYGVFHHGRLIACSVLHFPGNGADNLGLYIHLPKKELNKVAHLEIQMVHPDFRGNGLQTIMCEIMLEEAVKNNFFHILATVSPKNIISRKNLEKIGLTTVKTKFKYGKNKRDIMYMTLSNKHGKKHMAMIKYEHA